MPGDLAVRDPSGSVGPGTASGADQFQRGLESFLNEARLLARFNHPALVRVYRFWKANGTAYMAMQYCPGATLKEARKAMRAPPDEAWLRAFIEPILSLAAPSRGLHRAGVFHRDISPDNILLLPNGRPILLDFGSARRVISQGTRSLTAVLKPNFAPIEQYADEAGMAQGPWTDLYALGATVHFMLTGEAPTPAVLRVVKDLRTPLVAAGPAAFPGVGAKFLAAIDWTAAVAPDDRPQSVEALRHALDDEQPRTPSAAAPRARGPALLALALAAFGVLAVGAWTLGSATIFASSAPPRMTIPAPAPSVAPAASALAVARPAADHVTPASSPVAPPAPDAMVAAAKPETGRPCPCSEPLRRSAGPPRCRCRRPRRHHRARRKPRSSRAAPTKFAPAATSSRV